MSRVSILEFSSPVKKKKNTSLSVLNILAETMLDIYTETKYVQQTLQNREGRGLFDTKAVLLRLSLRCHLFSSNALFQMYFNTRIYASWRE